jgi:hypothetical protein
MWHVWGRTEINRGVWWGNTKEVDHVEDMAVDGKYN